MTKKRVFFALYLLLGLGFMLNGAWMLTQPYGWYQEMPLDLLDMAGLPNAHLIRILGLAYLALAPLCLWCAQNLRKRKPVHLALSVLVVGHAVVNGLEIAANPHLHFTAMVWAGQAGLIFVPALIMVAMALPPMPSRVRGPREQGQVKWFNAAKGFGFITRQQGEDVFVHYRSIRGDGHRTLREGQKVEFVVVKGEKGLQAEDVCPL